MGRGLSPLQRCILTTAYENRQLFGAHDGPDALYGDVLARYFKFPVKRIEYWASRDDRPYRVTIDRAAAGAKAYNAAFASLSRAATRLGERGLVQCWQWAVRYGYGVRLTPEGSKVAKTLLTSPQPA